ncbi:glycosyltransferase [Actinoplanes sp. NPDC023714]|uniref:glycosyltransferase n=1 Tax=Actinoplanes sp. NPDC023714 TaxID=3154322 RepID=UPI0033DF6C4E
MRQNGGTPVFVIPHYCRSAASWDHLHATVDSLLRQSDPGWHAVVADDASPGPDVQHGLERIRAIDPERITVIRAGSRGGPGARRNDGVRWAARRGAPFVLFQDSDDLAHPERLRRTRRLLDERPDIDMVYSSFSVIDETGTVVPRRELTPSVQEILESHENPLQGPAAWIPIGVERGYTTLTSTVSVRTALAAQHPFPATHVAEDDHAWFRLLAAGDGLGFLPDTEAAYRIPRAGQGSASRDEHGSSFYWASALMAADGFSRALAIAERRGTVDAAESESLRRRFHDRLAVTMHREGVTELAAALRALTLP